MKIGIFTFKPNNNYGGILQAFAMMTIIKSLGHEVVFINRHINYNLSAKQKAKIVLKRFIKKHILNYKNITKVFAFPTKADQKNISRHTTNFIKNNIYPNTPIFTDKEELKIGTKNLDCIIVGSDQIWRKEYAKDALYNYFLDFTKDMTIKKIAYAASWGIDYWQYTLKETLVIKQLLKDFNAISVREKSGVELCKKYLEINANHVLDPTLLVNKSIYESLTIGSRKPQGNLLTYIIDPNKDTQAILSILKQKYKPFSVFVQSKEYDDSLEIRTYPPVENWLSGFIHADYVLTDSFHGCVFSIIFNKQFIVYANSERGKTRFESLLSTFNLNERLICNLKNFNDDLMNSTINWKEVNYLLEIHKQQSIDFLQSALKQTS